jgi:superoxide dismutase, Fe-Mn family
MNILVNDNIKKIIKDSLELSSEKEINEAFVAQQKKFTINTDFLTPGNINNHIELYHGYLEKFNETSAKLDSVKKTKVDSNHSEYRSIKLDETYNMNGAYLHELYFANIGDSNSTINMDSLAYMRLNRDFGTFDDWQKDFMACAKSSRCGWVITYLNMYTQSYMNCFVDLHSQNVPVGMYPIIVIDMWQHAYYKDYLKDSSSYLSAMMKELRWPTIEKRFQNADKILQAIKGV